LTYPVARYDGQAAPMHLVIESAKEMTDQEMPD